jgi:hypothetical protein
LELNLKFIFECAFVCLLVSRKLADGVIEEENEEDLEVQYREPELEDPGQELPEGFIEGKSNPFLLTMFIPVFKHNP